MSRWIVVFRVNPVASTPVTTLAWMALVMGLGM